MKRIIHVFGKMNCGGAETRTMEIYRKINREEIQFDFLTMKSGSGYYDSEIRELGGKVFTISTPSKVSVLTHVREIINILKNEGPFFAVHAHTAYHSGIICLSAYIADVKVRIVHSRSASDPRTEGINRKIYFFLMKILMQFFSTNMIACGQEAARFLYGYRKVKKGNVKIIKNAIDFSPYKKLSFRSPNLRNKLNINIDKIVLGHVGSFVPVKNHEFLISILKILQSTGVKFKMVLVGDGKLKDSIELKVKEQGLSDYVLFLGLRSDIPELMSMFDILLLPSFYEGIPGVVVEAQAAGTPCIVSNTVTREVDSKLGLLHFAPINNLDRWKELILNIRTKKEMSSKLIYDKLNNNGFTVENSISKLSNIYKMHSNL